MHSATCKPHRMQTYLLSIYVLFAVLGFHINRICSALRDYSVLRVNDIGRLVVYVLYSIKWIHV